MNKSSIEKEYKMEKSLQNIILKNLRYQYELVL